MTSGDLGVLAEAPETDNWDDDFEFGGDAQEEDTLKQEVLLKRVSMGTFQPFTLEWESEPLPRVDTKKLAVPPRTPTKSRSQAHVWGDEGSKTSVTSSPRDTENWDEDFESGSGSSGSQLQLHVLPAVETSRLDLQEDWDDEPGPSSRFRQRESFDEDQTITTRLHRLPSRSSLNQAVNSLNHTFYNASIEPFPHSPSHSTFSVPASSTVGRSTVHHPSSSYLALTGKHDVSRSSAHPPSAHRERRRLRKKSRPVQHSEYVVAPDHEVSDIPPRPSDVESTEAEFPPVLPDATLDLSTPGVPESKTSSFLSRMGSWGGKKRSKRHSTPGSPKSVNEPVFSLPKNKEVPSSYKTPTYWFSLRNKSNKRDSVSTDGSSPPRPMDNDDVSPGFLSPPRAGKKSTAGSFGGGNSSRRTSSIRPSSSQSAVSSRRSLDSSARSVSVDVERTPAPAPASGHRPSASTGDHPRTRLTYQSEMAFHNHPPPSTWTAATVPVTPMRSASAQTSSLSRASLGQTPPSATRRSSMGDLKIPTRISQAQTGIKRDLHLVKEFAASVEAIKDLQAKYRQLIKDIQAAVEATPPPPPPPPPVASASFFNLSRPPSRTRSNTTPLDTRAPTLQLSKSSQAIYSKYRVSWECAELLIDIGGGRVDETSTPFAGKSRERAITLTGPQPPPSDEMLSKPLPDLGKQDLNHRQLVLLRDMIKRVPDGIIVNRDWKWGDVQSSTANLAATPTSSPDVPKRSKTKTFVGLRNMLGRRSTDRAATTMTRESSPSSSENNGLKRRRSKLTRKGKTSATRDGESHNIAVSGGAVAPDVDQLQGHRPSPRRPSIANLFRVGSVKKANDNDQEEARPRRSSVDGGDDEDDESDWDHMDTASDREVAGAPGEENQKHLPSSTGRGGQGQSPYMEQQRRHSDYRSRPPTGSRSSLFGVVVPTSPFNSMAKFITTTIATARDNQTASSAGGTQTGTTRSAEAPISVDQETTSTDVKLLMAPENIKPLLDSAREVQKQLEDCLLALRQTLVDSGAT